jgi:hypothetical protein
MNKGLVHGRGLFFDSHFPMLMPSAALFAILRGHWVLQPHLFKNQSLNVVSHPIGLHNILRTRASREQKKGSPDEPDFLVTT